MYKTKRFLTALAAIFMLATGASAQTETNAVDVTLNTYVKGTKQYTATFQMPDDQGVTLEVEYEKIPEAITLPSDEGYTYAIMQGVGENQKDITSDLCVELADLADEPLTFKAGLQQTDNIWKVSTVFVGAVGADMMDMTRLTPVYDMQGSFYTADFTMDSERKSIQLGFQTLRTATITPQNGWATWVVPEGRNFTVPEGVLCTVSETNGAEAVANALATTKAVPAGTPLLVNGTGEITLTESRATKDEDIFTAEEIGTNLLKAGDGATEWTLAQNVYGLYNGQFYLLEGQVATDKAYLQLAASAARSLSIAIGGGVDGTTGINAVEGTEADDAPMYNLQGVRVGRDYKGIVIKNGKKQVVK